MARQPQAEATLPEDIKPLIGHKEQQDMLRTLYLEKRLPHAILLHGPKGIGKRLFADILARTVLCGLAGEAPAQHEAEEDAGAGFMFDDAPANIPEPAAEPSAALGGLTYNTQHPRYAQAVAGSHPDFHILVPEDGKKSISVEQVRALNSLLGFTAEGARVIIVDAAEDMTNAAANAMLKSLEEPGQGVHWVLVSHALSRLLPTVISRCRAVRFAPLQPDESLAVLQENHPDTAQDELQSVNAFVGGCPGQAERYMGAAAEVGAMLESFLKTLSPTPKCRREALALSDKLGQKRIADLAVDILLTRLAQAVRRASYGEEVFGKLNAYALTTVYQNILVRKRQMQILNINATMTLDACLEDLINASAGVMPRLVA